MKRLSTVTDAEREVILLLTARQSIQSMVNHASLTILEEEPGYCTIRPHEAAQAELFNIRLLDFLSPVRHLNGNPTLLRALQSICEAPTLIPASHIEYLKDAVQAMSTWLHTTVEFERIWLPAINLELTLPMKRIEFLRICGNIAKHHAFHLNKVIADLLTIIQRTSPNCSEEDAFLTLHEFYQWFHQDIFYYHLTKICELLNNIDWGIQHSLKPVYETAYQQVDAVQYKFAYPSDVNDSVARYSFWELMNTVRSGPYVQPFQTWKYLTLCY